MIRLIKLEIFKIFTKPRTYIGFGAIAFIVLAVQAGFYFEGEQMLEFMVQNLKEKFSFKGKLINANTVTYVIMHSLWLHIPILISLVAGDLIAGEANSGTFRLILTRPVSRTKLLIAKFFAGWLYTVALVVLLMFIGLVIGNLIFGSGDLIVIRQTINIFTADDVLWRFGYAFIYGVLTMTVVTSLSFMLSAFSDNSIGPIVGTFAIIIGLTIVSTLGYAMLKPILPYLFTSHLRSWNLFFEMDLNYEELIRGTIVNFAYIIVFLTITFTYFRKKDILS